MNTLQLYYSYIKSPYSTQTKVNEKNIFILDVYSCVHSQMAKNLFLLIHVFFYYFNTQDVIPSEKYAFININSRGPPEKEVYYGINCK